MPRLEKITRAIEMANEVLEACKEFPRLRRREAVSAWLKVNYVVHIHETAPLPSVQNFAVPKAFPYTFSGYSPKSSLTVTYSGGKDCDPDIKGLHLWYNRDAEGYPAAVMLIARRYTETGDYSTFMLGFADIIEQANLAEQEEFDDGFKSTMAKMEQNAADAEEDDGQIL